MQTKNSCKIITYYKRTHGQKTFDKKLVKLYYINKDSFYTTKIQMKILKRYERSRKKFCTDSKEFSCVYFCT